MGDSMVRTFLLAAFLLLAVLPVKAQDQKWEAFMGYQFTSFQVLHGFAANPPKAKGNGFDASVNYRFKNWLGAKADLSYGSGSGGTQLGVSNGPTSLLTYTFGPVVSYTGKQFKPFGEFLIGRYSEQVQYFASTTFHGLALMAGGGADVRVGRQFAVRLFEV